MTMQHGGGRGRTQGGIGYSAEYEPVRPALPGSGPRPTLAAMTPLPGLPYAHLNLRTNPFRALDHSIHSDPPVIP